MGEQKIGIQAPGPPRRDPGRNSAQDPSPGVPNGGMANYLGAKRCDLGPLGVLGPASTPWAGRLYIKVSEFQGLSTKLLSACLFQIIKYGASTEKHEVVGGYTLIIRGWDY